MKDYYYLSLRYGVSKGNETYGYTTVSLRDEKLDKRVGYCLGGGYDMKGTVFAEWMKAEFKELIPALDPYEFYGVTHIKQEDGSVKSYLDGACGYECMTAILKHWGYEIERTACFKSGDLQSFTVRKKETTQ